MAKKRTPIAIKNKADLLGHLRGKIKELTDEAKELENDLLTYALQTEKFVSDGKSFSTVIDGKNFSAKVLSYDRPKTNWRAIAEKLKASKYMIKRFTKNTPVTQVRIYAHSKNQK